MQEQHISEWENYFAVISAKIESDQIDSTIYVTLNQSSGGFIPKRAAFICSIIIDPDDVVQYVTFRRVTIAKVRNRSVDLDKLAEQLSLARLVTGRVRKRAKCNAGWEVGR